MPNFQSQITGTLNTILGSAAVKQIKRNTDIEAAKKAGEAIDKVVSETETPYKNDQIDPELLGSFQDTLKLRSTKGRQSIATEYIDPNSPAYGKERQAYAAVAEQHAWEAQNYANDAALRVAQTAKAQLSQMYKLRKDFFDQT